MAVLGLIILLGGSVWYVKQNGLTGERQREEKSSVESSALLPVQARLVPVENGVSEDQEVLEFGDIAELKPIGSDDGRGLAMRSYDGAKFVHSIEASLPELPAGAWYEGWLAGSDNSEELISTGRLDKYGEEWRLLYKSEEVPVELNVVVVAIERAEAGQDGQMGERVLEGAF